MPIADWLPNPPPLNISIGFGLKRTLFDYVNQTSADSTVRILPLSRFYPDFPENRVRCLSAVRILAGL